MGSTMKPTIFNERVAAALKNWHHTAKKHIKESKHSSMASPMSSRPATPYHGMSPVHLLRNYRSEVDSYQNSPNRTNWENDDGSTSPTKFHNHHHYQGFSESSSSHNYHQQQQQQQQHQIELGSYVEQGEPSDIVNGMTTTTTTTTNSSSQVVPLPVTNRQHEINIGRSTNSSGRTKDFSFDKRTDLWENDNQKKKKKG